MTGTAPVDAGPGRDDGQDGGRELGRDVKSNLALGLLNNLSLRVGNLAVGIVLARLLAPEDFGVFAVALTLQAVLANLTDLGMTAYLVRCEDVGRRAPTVLGLGLAVGVALASLMVVLAGPLAEQLGSSEATPVIQVLALTLVLSGIGSVPTAIIQRRLQQGRQLVADLSSFVVSTATALLLIASGMGAMSLAWSRVLGQLVAVVLLFALSGYRGRVGFDRSVAREAYVFGLPLMGANVLSWVLLNMDYVLVGRIFGAATLGAYVLAFNIASWPTAAISQALRAVALPAFVRGEGQDARARTQYVGEATALTIAAGAPIGALLAALSLPLIVVVYGDRWSDAAAPLATLAAFGVLRPVFDLLATYLTARGVTTSVLWVQLIWAVTLFPALLVGIEAGGPAGAGLAHLAVGLVVVLPAYLVILRRDGLAIGVVLAKTVKPLLAAGAAGVVAFGISRLISNDVLAVLGAGIVAGPLYLALMYRPVRGAVANLRAVGASAGADDETAGQTAEQHAEEERREAVAEVEVAVEAATLTGALAPAAPRLLDGDR